MNCWLIGPGARSCAQVWFPPPAGEVSNPMNLIINTTGCCRCIYDEAIDLNLLGDVRISRASHVEPDEVGRWWADCSPVNGPMLGPFEARSYALQAETQWLA